MRPQKKHIMTFFIFLFYINSTHAQNVNCNNFDDKINKLKLDKNNIEIIDSATYNVTANDGKDDYLALKNLSVFLSNSTSTKNRVVIFPEGEININQSIIT